MRRSPSIDFLHPQRSPVLGWWLLAGGMAAMALASAQYGRTRTELQAREDIMQQRAMAQERARRVALRPVLPTTDERRLRHVAAQLRQPWLAALAAIESATQPPIYLLALSIDPATGRIKLEGEAPSFDHAMAYAQLLDQDGTLAQATLASHERVTVESGPTPPVVRFTALTRWNGP